MHEHTHSLSSLPVSSAPPAPLNTARLDVALVHDWLPVYAGAERVLEQMIHVFPQADIFSLIDFLPDRQRGFLQGKSVNTSLIQNLPFAASRYRYYLPLAPYAVEQFDLRGYDLVISSSYVVAKGVLTTANQLHVSYIHSPIRYAWDLYFQYLYEAGLRRGLKNFLVRLILHYLRMYDVSTANRVDVFLANSKYVARRIWKTYRRKAKVIYPPVDTSRFELTPDKDDYYLTTSRLVPYKKIDLIIEAFLDMPDKQLLIIGDGPDRARLEAMLPKHSNISLLGYQPPEALQHYMEHAKAFVFAAEEDFGIAPVEAQACGTPVIALGKGGTAETVIHGETGILFPEQSKEALQHAIELFEKGTFTFEPERLRIQAERFSAERFQLEFALAIEEAWTTFCSSELNI